MILVRVSINGQRSSTRTWCVSGNANMVTKVVIVHDEDVRVYEHQSSEWVQLLS